MPVAIALTIAWGAVTYGAVYRWGYVPLLLACAAAGAHGLTRRGPGFAVNRPVAASLLLVAGAIAVQLVPIPRPLLLALSPQTDQILQRHELGYALRAAGSAGAGVGAGAGAGAGAGVEAAVPWHALSVAPGWTLLALAFLAAFAVMLVGLARGLRAVDARRTIEGVAFVGALLAVGAIVHRAAAFEATVGFWVSEPGTFVNRNHFAGWMLMALPLVLGYFVGVVAAGRAAAGATAAAENFHRPGDMTGPAADRHDVLRSSGYRSELVGKAPGRVGVHARPNGSAGGVSGVGHGDTRPDSCSAPPRGRGTSDRERRHRAPAATEVRGHAGRSSSPPRRHAVSRWLSSGDANRIALLGASVIVMALALVMTLSRSGILGFGGALLLIALAVVKKRHASWRARAAVLGFIVVVVGAVVGRADVASVTARFEAIPADAEARLGAWRDTLQIFRDFPLAGTGIGTYEDVMLFYQSTNPLERFGQAHNDYLQILAEGGLLVSLPAVLLLGVFVREVRRRFADSTDDERTYWIRVGAVTGLLAMGLQEIGEFSLQCPGNTALFVLLMATAVGRLPHRGSRGHDDTETRRTLQGSRQKAPVGPAVGHWGDGPL
ncbi:MAG: O-antigen ligase family protein [Vicinamibacterales bacterium]